MTIFQEKYKMKVKDLLKKTDFTINWIDIIA